MVTEYLGAAKLGFDTIRAMFGVFRDVKDTLPTDEQRQALESAIHQSEQQFAIAEAQMAQALGYQLCRCEFPPNIMVQVGVGKGRPTPIESGAPVFQCPKCLLATSGPWAFIKNDRYKPNQT